MWQRAPPPSWARLSLYSHVAESPTSLMGQAIFMQSRCRELHLPHGPGYPYTVIWQRAPPPSWARLSSCSHVAESSTSLMGQAIFIQSRGRELYNPHICLLGASPSSYSQVAESSIFLISVFWEASPSSYSHVTEYSTSFILQTLT
jgi:hypothetical protein